MSHARRPYHSKGKFKGTKQRSGDFDEQRAKHWQHLYTPDFTPPPRLSARGFEKTMEWLIAAPDLMLDRNLKRPDFRKLTRSELAPARTWSLPPRLGKQFEQMISYYLKLNSQISDFKTNKQLIVGGRTLGELDLLAKVEGQWWHIELAYKLYLKRLGIAGLEGWVGPGHSDNLIDKWVHLVDQQVCRTDKFITRHTLANQGIENLNRAIWVKGALFLHPSEWNTKTGTPINPHHERGWWIERAELPGFLAGQLPQCRYLRVSKVHWLVPVSEQKSRPISATQLVEETKQLTQPEQIWIVLGEGYSRQRLSRGFIVPDGWSDLGGA